MLATVLWAYRGIVALVVGALVYDFYAPSGLSYTFGDTTYMIVLAAALVEPVFWAAMHLCGGILMGLTAGGLLDGVKLSLMLGIGLGLSRLWPYVLAASVGVYAGSGPLLYSVGGLILAGALFGLDKAMTWMWHHARLEN